MIIEAVQAQPVEFLTGYFSGRLWINAAEQPRTYFGDASKPLFQNLNSVELNFCARWNTEQTGIAVFGNYDVMNLIWFRGAEGLYIPPESNSRLIICLDASHLFR